MTTFEGRDFLATATFLATRTADEGSQRSAISRAYYACFHRARDHARERSAVIRPDGSAHAAVRRLLEASDPKIAFELQRLHRLRKYADYDVPFPRWDVTSAVEVALDLAAVILDTLDSLAIDPALPAEET